MTNANLQILQAYEQGLAPEDIAVQFEYEPEAVKAILLQCSTAYRKAVGKDEELVTAEERAEFMATYKSLGRYSDNPCVQERVLKNLINLSLKANKGLGATDAVQEMKSSNVNIVVFNERLTRGREAINAARQPKQVGPRPTVQQSSVASSEDVAVTLEAELVPNL